MNERTYGNIEDGLPRLYQPWHLSLQFALFDRLNGFLHLDESPGVGMSLLAPPMLQLHGCQFIYC